MMIVLLLRLTNSLFNILILWVSSADIGSSNMISEDFFNKHLTKATFCFSPPDKESDSSKSIIFS